MTRGARGSARKSLYSSSLSIRSRGLAATSKTMGSNLFPEVRTPGGDYYQTTVQVLIDITPEMNHGELTAGWSTIGPDTWEARTLIWRVGRHTKKRTRLNWPGSLRVLRHLLQPMKLFGCYIISLTENRRYIHGAESN